MALHLILILSLVQGFAEFVPVSSAAHLLLVQKWLSSGPNIMAFDLALNLGTLLTILVYFKKDVLLMGQEFILICRGQQKNITQTLLFKLVIASIPVTIVGAILVKIGLIEVLRAAPLLIATCLIVFGIILYVADIMFKADRPFAKITPTRALIIGLVQCLALMPGVSRSGSTITAARILKINRKDSVRFSFLIAIPSTFGAVLLTTMHTLHHHMYFPVASMVLGVMFSFTFGLLFISFLLKYLANHSFLIFMIYRIVLGIIILVAIHGGH